MIGIDLPLGPNGQTQISFIVKAVQKEGQAGRFFRFRIEVGSEAKPDAASVEADHDYPLSNGQTLAKVLKVDVKPGLYKIGTPVRLATICLEGVDQPLTMHVYWKEADKK
jgi:hypothetical protein